MILNNKQCRPRNKTLFYMGGLFVAVMALITAAYFRQEKGIFSICIFYAVVTSIFLFAQVVAFVASHACYSDSIEQPKFQLLDNEEKEWAGFRG